MRLAFESTSYVDKVVCNDIKHELKQNTNNGEDY